MKNSDISIYIIIITVKSALYNTKDKKYMVEQGFRKEMNEEGKA